MIRLYEPQSLAQGLTITLGEHATHHLNVMRARVNDEVVLFNGTGGEYQASIVHITKKQIQVAITDFSNRDLESPVAIHLVQGIPKGDKMDFIVQKAVELGVASITLVTAERSQGRLSKEQEQKKLLRLQTIAISAAEQCGRCRIPTINPPITLANWLTLTDKDPMHRLILTPQEALTTAPILSPPLLSIALLIGPEGGFSENELTLAAKHQLQCLTLGKRILRTETAALAAISIIQWCYGDLCPTS